MNCFSQICIDLKNTIVPPIRHSNQAHDFAHSQNGNLCAIKTVLNEPLVYTQTHQYLSRLN